MSENESTPPIVISRSTKLTAPFYLVVSFVLFIISVTIAWAELREADRNHTTRISALESRVTRLEELNAVIAQDVANTKTNVEWMRRWMEGRYANNPPAPLK